MISENVRTYLQTPHVGALMISGPWGCGKTYYIKNTLIAEIRNVECPLEVVEASRTLGLYKQFKFLWKDDKNVNYYPIMVSAFGKGSVKEIEDEIVRGFMDSILDGHLSKLAVVKKWFQKALSKSKKINEWFDVASLLDYKPGIGMLPKNVVVILDDLERVGDKISEIEILGFLNNICENLGHKTIIIANENYITDNEVTYGSYKEKVIERNIIFEPDYQQISNSIINGFKNHSFKKLIEGNSKIQLSLDFNSNYVISNPVYKSALLNLRTLRFALNNFFSLFEVMTEYKTSTPIEEKEWVEILEHIWFSVIALSIEMKTHHISSFDLKGLDSFFYLSKLEMQFDSDDNKITPEELFSDHDADDDQSGKKQQLDTNYANKFYEFYFRNRGLGLLPIASPEIINFIVSGVPVNCNKLVKNYRETKRALVPSVSLADRILTKFTRGLANMSNAEVESNLTALLEETEKGEFSELTGFVNATVYLCGFASLIKGESKDQILDKIKRGIDKHLCSREVPEIEKSRFLAISGMVEGEEPQQIYQYISQKINETEKNALQRQIEKLKQKFENNLPQFCAEICPQGFSGENSIGITRVMTSPILDKISNYAISKKIELLTISDVSALSALLDNRYSISEVSELKKAELSFWKTLKDSIDSVQSKSAGTIMYDKILKHKLERFISTGLR